MKVRDFMKQRVISIPLDATIGSAVQLFREHHIGTLPVIDDDKHLVGIVRLRSILALAMPDFINLVTHFEFAHDFGAVEFHNPNADQFNRPIAEIMEEPVSAEADSGLVRAAALIRRSNLIDLPIVDKNNVLVGLASHVDVGIAMMSHWDLNAKDKE